MNGKVANPKALGFGVFAIGMWLFSMYFSGLATFPYGSELGMVSMLLGIGMLVAGVAAFLRNEAWLAFFFILWAALSFASGGGAASGWLWFAIALVNIYLWLGAKSHGLAVGVGLIALLAGLDALGQGLSRVAGLYTLGQIGAYIGLAAAALAFYVSATTIMCPQGCSRLPLLGSKGNSQQD